MVIQFAHAEAVTAIWDYQPLRDCIQPEAVHKTELSLSESPCHPMCVPSFSFRANQRL